MKAKDQTKRITAEPANKAQPGPSGGAAASSTEAPPPLGSRPGTVSRDGKKAIWVSKIGPNGAFGGG